MKIACLQVASPDDESRGERIARVLAQVADVGDADLVVLPELWPTGYFAFDRYEADAEAIDGDLVTSLRRVATDQAIHLLAGSFIERHGEGLANCAILIGPDGELRNTYRKIHLFSYGSEEARLLTAGRDASPAATDVGCIGMSTCYDLRFPELYRLLVDRGADLICIPAAWPLARLEHWRLLLQARAVENQSWVVACNAAGTQRGTALAGHSMVIDPWGAIVAEAGEEPTELRAEIDLDRVHELRRDFPVLEHRRIGVGQPEGSVAG